MDGEDRRQIGFFGRHAQAPAQLHLRFAALLQMALQDAVGKCGFRAVGSVRFHAHQSRRQIQPLADALAQLLGSGVGEGHRQDLAHAQALFHHQAGEQRRQGERFAGAGAGFDQAQAVQRQIQIGIVRCVVHAAPSPLLPSDSTGTFPSRSAENINRLLWINLCAVFSLANGSSPRSANCSASPLRSPQL
ncbi:hypothetical protein D3C71_1306610 [compost metagenome]